MDIISAILIIGGVIYLLTKLWHINYRSEKRASLSQPNPIQKAGDDIDDIIKLASFVPPYPPSETRESICKACTIMEQSVLDYYSFNPLILKTTIASYVSALVALVYVPCRKDINQIYIDAGMDGISDYCHTFMTEDEYQKAKKIFELDRHLYIDIAYHRITPKGIYEDSSKLEIASTDIFWKLLSCNVSLDTFNPGLMPFLFMDLIYDPMVRYNYATAPNVRRVVVRSQTDPFVKNSPEVGLYSKGVDPIMYLIQKGLILDHLGIFED